MNTQTEIPTIKSGEDFTKENEKMAEKARIETEQRNAIANADVEFEGEPIKLGRETYIVCGLSFAQAEKLAPIIDRMSKVKKDVLTPSIINDLMIIIHSAVSRNYPKMTLERLKELIDIKNAQKVFFAVMGASGFDVVAVDDAKGNAKTL